MYFGQAANCGLPMPPMQTANISCISRPRTEMMFSELALQQALLRPVLLKQSQPRSKGVTVLTPQCLQIQMETHTYILEVSGADNCNGGGMASMTKREQNPLTINQL